VPRLVQVLGGALTSYASIAWWGLAAPRLSEREPLVVLQGVVCDERGVLLAVRDDPRGWELPGGALEPGEQYREALRRELDEETGLDVEVLDHVGDYRRTGFRPHTAKVYRCRAVSGRLRPGSETRALRWFDPAAFPDTLFPWYREPLADALGGRDTPVERDEHQGLQAVLAGLRIDLRMRWSDDRAG
jgi:8-oxo-dGTP diphosphatase